MRDRKELKIKMRSEIKIKKKKEGKEREIGD